MIVSDPRILSTEWLLIGRQEQTSHGGRIDLLAIAPDASLVLIELKRDRTPREIVAQALDYASWVESLTPDKIAKIYQRFSNDGKLNDAFQKRFGAELDDEMLNQSHQIIIVASELDPSTERIINYLNARDIAINAASGDSSGLEPGNFEWFFQRRTRARHRQDHAMSQVRLLLDRQSEGDEERVVEFPQLVECQIADVV